jgi:hypothetical protein
MLTREALNESLAQAKADYARAPADGMLAHLIALVEIARDGWDREGATIVALAYANAVQKNGGRG